MLWGTVKAVWCILYFTCCALEGEDAVGYREHGVVCTYCSCCALEGEDVVGYSEHGVVYTYLLCSRRGGCCGVQ